MSEDTTLDYLTDPACMPGSSSTRMAPAQVLPRLALEETLTPAQMQRIKSSTGMMLLIKVPSEDWIMPLEEYLATDQPLGYLQFYLKDGSGRRRLSNAGYGLQTFLEWIASGKPWWPSLTILQSTSPGR
ncbi:hypothetical protein [Pelagibacterium sp. H642]|uniref:hypothetical protein n=1 Tax=Pelagibacterium sp. H642 TaxID=1881069 RepID=UPI0028163A79|nr:hypothetical protein [Pelagibacterium sp. H642]WMT90456.1 hypothetical protein NO934_17010 [Pelagibacterium sp. H642]